MIKKFCPELWMGMGEHIGAIHTQILKKAAGHREGKD